MEFDALIGRAKIRQVNHRQSPSIRNESSHNQTASPFQKSLETSTHFSSDFVIPRVSESTGDLANASRNPVFIGDQQNLVAPPMLYNDNLNSIFFPDFDRYSMDGIDPSEGGYGNSIVSPLNTTHQTQFNFQHNDVPFSCFSESNLSHRARK